MVAGIGVDVVEIARFAAWHTFSHAQLRRIFSEKEIAHCLAVPARSAERFAVRFAAREALFKALSQAGYPPIPFLKLCAAVQLVHAPSGAPELVIDWNMLGLGAQKSPVLLSLSHANTVAIAMVVVQ